MNKKILSFIMLSSIATTLFSQVGIATSTLSSTNSVFEIKGDPSVSGNGDRLVINNNGNVGIGTTTPTAKLEIVKNGNNAPFRIVDGKVAANKVMGTDNNGYITWVDMPDPAGVNYHILGSRRTFANNTYVLLQAFPVSKTGFYQLVLRWWGKATTFNANMAASAVFYLATSTSNANNWTADSGNMQDSAEEYVLGKTGSDSNTFCFTIPFSAQASQGSYLKLYIRVTNGGPWIIGDPSTNSSTWNPSVSIFKI